MESLSDCPRGFCHRRRRFDHGDGGDRVAGSLRQSSLCASDRKRKAAHTVRLSTATRFGQSPQIDGQMFLEEIACDGNRLKEFWSKLWIWTASGLCSWTRIASLLRRLISTRRWARVRQSDRPAPSAQSSDAVSIGAEILRGRRTLVYRLPKIDLFGMKGSGEMLVWVDAESELPAKIAVRDTDPKAEQKSALTNRFGMSHRTLSCSL